MSKSTTVVWASFPTHEAASHMKERLIANGFARNSIEIYRQGKGSACDVAVHTREHNLHRVEQLLHASGPVYALRQMTDGAIKSATSNPLVIGGGLALAGLVVYALLPRNRRTTVQSIRELPKALRSVPETVASAARAAPSAAKNVADMFYQRAEGHSSNSAGDVRS